jgi:ribonuclease Z
MKIPIIFLGTSQAIPTEKRNHTAVLLKYKDETILIDCGEGTQRQFRKAKINPCKLTRILITHWHGDHILGLPGLFQTLALSNYNKTLHIYIPKGTSKYIDLIFKIFVFQGKIKYEIHECDKGKILETKDFFIESEKMFHGPPTLAYSFTEKEKLRINKEKIKRLKIHGKIISELQKGKDIVWNNKKIKAKDLTYKQEGKKITIIMDTCINNNMLKIAKNSDLLITESTYAEKEASLAKEKNHLTASQAAQIAKKSKSKKLILTHLSQRYDNNEGIILNEAKKIFKNTFLAEDLMKVEV